MNQWVIICDHNTVWRSRGTERTPNPTLIYITSTAATTNYWVQESETRLRVMPPDSILVFTLELSDERQPHPRPVTLTNLFHLAQPNSDSLKAAKYRMMDDICACYKTCRLTFLKSGHRVVLNGFNQPLINLDTKMPRWHKGRAIAAALTKQHAVLSRPYVAVLIPRFHPSNNGRRMRENASVSMAQPLIFHYYAHKSFSSPHPPFPITPFSFSPSVPHAGSVRAHIDNKKKTVLTLTFPYKTSVRHISANTSAPSRQL